MYGYGYRYNSGLVLSAGGGAPFANTKSLSFDGVDDYVSAPQSFLNSASVFSMSFWAKKVLASDDVLIGDRIAVYQGMWLSWYSDSNVYFQVRGGANQSIIFSLPFDTDWHHFLCTFNNGVANVYVDGIIKGTFTFTAVVTPPTTGDNFRVGSVDASNFGNSTIDEVALWDSVIAIGDVWDGSGAATDLSLLATPPTNWYRMGDNGSWKSPQWLIPSDENKDKVSNYSFDLDGVDDFIDCGNDSVFNLTNAMTLSAWVKPSSLPLDDFIIAKRWTSNAYQMATNSSSRASASIWIGGVRYNVFGTTSLSVGTWYNIIITFNGLELKVYLNGTLEGTTSAVGNLDQTTDIVSIAKGLNTNSYNFNGNIDEVAIWNTVENPTNIYNGGIPTTISGAVAHYKMGEEATFSGGVWTVPDSVGSNNGTSNAMTIEDRVGEAPNSENNALSYNMDEVDRVTDTP